MTDTSLIFSVFGRDRGLSDTFRKVGDEAERTKAKIDDAMQAGDSARLTRQIDEAKAKVRELAAEYDKTGEADAFKNLKNAQVALSRLESVRRGLERVRDAAKEADNADEGKTKEALQETETAAQSLARVISSAGVVGFDSFRTSLNNAGTAATNISTNVFNAVGALIAMGGAAATAASVAVPSLYLIGAAAGSLPTALAGGGAALGVLKLGLTGISEAFQQTASSGAKATVSASSLRHAEQAVTNALREVKAAQDAVNEARKTAAERIDDLGRSLARARLDEEGAVMGVTDAERALREARRGGDISEIRHAELAYRQSLLTVDEVKDRVGDLQEQQDEASRTGVEGSKEVQDALERQRRATEALTEAQLSLREAQNPPSSGGGSAAKKLIELAPAAKEFVAVIKSLKPAWDDLRLDVQQQLFAGIGGEVRQLAHAWLPQLHLSLGGMASVFNGIFKDAARAARRPEFVANIGAAIDTVSRAFGRVGTSLPGLIDAFGRLARAAGPFISTLADEVTGLVNDFSRWISSADNSGKLDDFFIRASGFLHDLFDIGRDVASIMGSIFSILLGADQNATTAPWVSFKQGMDDLAAWFKDPQNQETIRGYFQKIGDFLQWLVDDGLPKAKQIVDEVAAFVNTVDQWATRVENFGTTVKDGWNSIVKFLGELPARISSATAGMFDGIKNAFRSAINTVIAGWNRLEFQLPGFTYAGMHIGGFTLGVPDIQFLAKGGVIAEGGAAVVGDAGPEIVDLPKGARVTPLSRLGGASEVRVVFDIRGGDAEMRRIVRKWLRTEGGLEGA